MDVAVEIDQSHTNRAYLGERRLHPSLAATTDMAEALAGATLVVVAVPSHGLRSTLSEAGVSSRRPCTRAQPFQGPRGDDRRPDVRGHLRRLAGSARRGVDGPEPRGRVFDGQPTASVIAIVDEDLGRELQDLFSTDRLRVIRIPISSAVRSPES